MTATCSAALINISISDASDLIPPFVSPSPSLTNVSVGPGEQISSDLNAGANLGVQPVTSIGLCESNPCMFDRDNNVVNASDVLVSSQKTPSVFHITFQSDPNTTVTHNPTPRSSKRGASLP
jgi:hypothetical protein